VSFALYLPFVSCCFGKCLRRQTWANFIKERKMLAERIDVVQRFSELFRGTFPFTHHPFRLITDDISDYNVPDKYGIKYNGNMVGWCDTTGCPIVIPNRGRNVCQMRRIVTDIGRCDSWRQTDDTDDGLRKIHSNFYKSINDLMVKLLLAAGTNRTDISIGQNIGDISVSEMIKRYRITCLCVPDDFDIDTDLPIYTFPSLKNRVIGLSIPDLSESPLIIHLKNFNLFRDEAIDTNLIGIYGWIEASFIVYDSNCVFLARTFPVS